MRAGRGLLGMKLSWVCWLTLMGVWFLSSTETGRQGIHLQVLAETNSRFFRQPWVFPYKNLMGWNHHPGDAALTDTNYVCVGSSLLMWKWGRWSHLYSDSAFFIGHGWGQIKKRPHRGQARFGQGENLHPCQLSRDHTHNLSFSLTAPIATLRPQIETKASKQLQPKSGNFSRLLPYLLCQISPMNSEPLAPITHSASFVFLNTAPKLLQY